MSNPTLVPALAQTRSGDALMATWKPRYLSGTNYVFAHEDGGVTLEIRWPHRPSDRMSYMREEWGALVAFVEAAKIERAVEETSLSEESPA